MSSLVLDASALIALMKGEPGRDRVVEAIDRSIMSAVNLAEVVTVMLRYGIDAVELRRELGALNLPIVAFDQDLAWSAARFVRPGLSFGDRACLALAMARGLPVLTSDRAWSRLDLGVEIKVVR